MRILIFIFCFAGTQAFTQQAMTFGEARSNDLAFEQLDSEYAPALDADSDKGVFNHDAERFTNAYGSMLHDLNEYLAENGFEWTGVVRCFNRIYFNEAGKVDYFLYHFKPGILSDDQQRAFQELLTAFIKTYKFPLESKAKFTQCSPISYQ